MRHDHFPSSPERERARERASESESELIESAERVFIFRIVERSPIDFPSRITARDRGIGQHVVQLALRLGYLHTFEVKLTKSFGEVSKDRKLI